MGVGLQMNSYFSKELYREAKCSFIAELNSSRRFHFYDDNRYAKRPSIF